MIILYPPRIGGFWKLTNHMADEHFMSQEKLDQIKVELEELKTVKRKEISERIGTAKEQGDLSENFEYQEAKDQQAENERRIANLDHMIHHAVVIEHKSGESNISLGASFVAEDPGGNKRDFEIVGPSETDPMAGKISNESPLGKAFLGKKAGDVATFDAPSGEITYKIIAVK